MGEDKSKLRKQISKLLIFFCYFSQAASSINIVCLNLVLNTSSLTCFRSTPRQLQAFSPSPLKIILVYTHGILTVITKSYTQIYARTQ